MRIKLGVRLLAISVIYTVFFIIWNGYVFGGGDQAEHLPMLLKKWNPHLYVEDYYLKELSTHRFNVRTHYIKLLNLLCNEENLFYRCFLLNFLCIWLSIVGIMFWSKTRDSIVSCILAPFLVFFVFFKYWSIGDNLLAENSFVAGSLALPSGIWALALTRMNLFIPASIMVAIAGYFQFIIGLHVLFIILILFLFSFDLKLRLSRILYLLIIYFSFNLNQLSVIAGSMYDGENLCEGLSYANYFIKYRLKHHFLMSAFPISHYIKFLSLVFLSFIFYLISNPDPFWRSWFMMVIVVCGSYFLYYISTEIFGFDFAFKSQWPKLSIFLSAGASVYLSVFLSSRYDILFEKYYIKRSFYLLAILIILIIGGIYRNPVLDLPWNKEFNARRKMHDFIRHQTPTDAVFIISPLNDYFSFEAQRSLWIGYRAVWPDPDLACEWFIRFSTLFNIPFHSLKSKEKLLNKASEHFLSGNIKVNAVKKDNFFVLVESSDLLKKLMNSGVVFQKIYEVHPYILVKVMGKDFEQIIH